MVVRRSLRRIDRYADFAAAKMSAPIDEKETRLYFKLCQSSGWNKLIPPVGSSNPEIYPF